ncbi:MAG: protein kinase [Myxococcota bacterium]
MGEVYAARDLTLGRRVALKFIRMGQDHASSLEAIATARLNHPNIVTIYGVGRHRDLVYLVLEYVEGQSLRERLHHERPALHDVMRMGHAIADAMAAAHEAGVIHRDLKPENVLLGRDGRLRIVDFGVADLLRRSDAEPQAATTQAGVTSGDEEFPTVRDAAVSDTITGTPAYMAPEQWNNQHGKPADIWALGVVLFETLTGRRPYAERQPVLLYEQVTSSEPVDLTPMAHVPESLRELVAACLDKDPTARPDAAAVAARLASMTLGAAPRENTDESPFRGLLPFSERHAAMFHGRDVEIDALLERVREQPLIGVVGPTGAGKSSFVHAGVVPRLRGAGGWSVFSLRPGANPFRALAHRLASSEEEDLARQLRRKPELLGMRLREAAERTGTRVLLVVDQLEEVCTQGAPEQVRAELLGSLVHAAEDPDEPVRVLFTVRDDFLGRLAEGGAGREVFRNLMVLRAPDEEALLGTLVAPLTHAGYRMDDDTLAREMVSEVRGEAAALPMLQVAAQIMWERRDVNRRVLRRSTYTEMGGVAGALASHADGVLHAMSPSMVMVARALMLRLVTPEGTRQVLSRPRAVEGLGAEAAEVMERLVDARLVSVRRGRDADGEGEQVELAHESLISRWRQLASWVQESQVERAELLELSRAAARWRARGRRGEDLWPGARALEARNLLRRPDVHGDAEAQAFIAESCRALERSQRERRLIRGAVVGVATALTITAVVVALLMSAKEREARRQRDHAEQQRADAQREGARAALAVGDVVQARAKLRTSLETRDSLDARALWWTLAREPLWSRTNVGSTAYDTAISPDGNTTAVATQAGTVVLLDRLGRTQSILRGSGDQMLAVAFTHDGKTLYSASWDGEIRAWSLPAGSARVVGKHPDAVTDISVDAQDRVAAVSIDGAVRIWDPRTGDSRGAVATGRSVAFSPDGRMLAVGDVTGVVHVVSSESGQSVRALKVHEGVVRSVRFSLDGNWIVSTGVDEVAVVSRAADLTRVAVFRGHRGDVANAAFARAGAWLLTGGQEGAVQVWDSRTGRLLGRMMAGSRITDVEVDDARQVAVVSEGDGVIRVWDLTMPLPQPWRAGARYPVYGVDLGPDGNLVASGTNASLRTVLLWDAREGTVLRPLEDGAAAGSVRATRISPDGTLLAAAGHDPLVTIWRLPDGPVVHRLRGHGREVRDTAFSPDGTQLASASLDGTLRLWDVRTGEVMWIARGGSFRRVAFTADGALLATGSDDRKVTIWRRRDGSRVLELAGHQGAVDGVDFSPNGKRLASGGADGEVWLWEVSSGKGRKVGRRDGRIYALAFHPDGERVVTSSSAGVVEVWSLADGNRRVIGSHPAEVNRVRLSVDGKRAVTGGDDQSVGMWDVERGGPLWFSGGVLRSPVRVLTHRGWTTPQGAPVDVAGVPEGAQRLASRGETRCMLRDGRLVGQTSSGAALFTVPDVRADDLLAVERGCVVRTGGEVRVWKSADAPVVLSLDARAVGVDGEVLIATPTLLQAFTVDGKLQSEQPGSPLTTAIARSGSTWILGLKDGTVEARAPGQSPRTLDRAGVTTVTVLAVAPHGLLAGGFSGGGVALWDLVSGHVLASDRVHGSVQELVFEDDALHVLSRMGDVVTLPLGDFTAERCALVERVAMRTPFGWQDGQVIDLPPRPANCQQEP